MSHFWVLPPKSLSGTAGNSLQEDRNILDCVQRMPPNSDWPFSSRLYLGRGAGGTVHPAVVLVDCSHENGSSGPSLWAPTWGLQKHPSGLSHGLRVPHVHPGWGTPPGVPHTCPQRGLSGAHRALTSLLTTLVTSSKCFSLPGSGPFSKKPKLISSARGRHREAQKGQRPLGPTHYPKAEG